MSQFSIIFILSKKQNFVAKKHLKEILPFFSSRSNFPTFANLKKSRIFSVNSPTDLTPPPPPPHHFIMDIRNNKRRNILTHARVNFNQSETSLLLRGGGGGGRGSTQMMQNRVFFQKKLNSFIKRPIYVFKK